MNKIIKLKQKRCKKFMDWICSIPIVFLLVLQILKILLSLLEIKEYENMFRESVIIVSILAIGTMINLLHLQYQKVFCKAYSIMNLREEYVTDDNTTSEHRSKARRYSLIGGYKVLKELNSRGGTEYEMVEAPGNISEIFEEMFQNIGR